MVKKNIEIKCGGEDFLQLDNINEFQGGLKKRTKIDIEKIIVSIKKYGFTFPFYIWKDGYKNNCLDGHGRLQALELLKSQGMIIPALPVVYIQAKNEEEAKNKILRLNSIYGIMTNESVLDFMQDFNINFDELSLPNRELLLFDNLNIDAEWKGMPEYESIDKTIYRSIIVHFKNEKNVQRFAESIGQKITEKIKFVWFPKAKINVVADKGYKSES